MLEKVKSNEMPTTHGHVPSESACAKAEIQSTRWNANHRFEIGDVIRTVAGNAVGSSSDIYKPLESKRGARDGSASLGPATGYEAKCSA